MQIGILNGAMSVDPLSVHSRCPPDILSWLQQRGWIMYDVNKVSHYNYSDPLFWQEAVAVEFVNFMRIGNE
jgi:hypothetical protein